MKARLSHGKAGARDRCERSVHFRLAGVASCSISELLATVDRSHRQGRVVARAVLKRARCSLCRTGIARAHQAHRRRVGSLVRRLLHESHSISGLK